MLNVSALNEYLYYNQMAKIANIVDFNSLPEPHFDYF